MKKSVSLIFLTVLGTIFGSMSKNNFDRKLGYSTVTSVNYFLTASILNLTHTIIYMNL
jgi:NADH:ubiquinone oxidoreductase subunit 2 (subunit N)